MAPTSATISALAHPFIPDLLERAWCSVPHPTLPLVATAHAKSVTVFSLASLSAHSSLGGGHERSVRCVAWKPALPRDNLCLVTGSFDSTAGLWRWKGLSDAESESESESGLSVAREVDFTLQRTTVGDRDKDKDWQFTLVLEGHDSEIKSATFSPSGNLLATCSRDKSVWIWQDVGRSEDDDEWETVAVLNEHDGDVKAVAWCPDVPGRRGGSDVLASASYDDTVRIWREDSDGDWVCVSVLEGHGATVWGVEWERKPRGSAFPRLMTFSADGTIRIWSLEEDPEDDEVAEAGPRGPRGGLGAIPNTMRRSLRENWSCTATLPAVHKRDIYSVSWSSTSGLVASTGSDGTVAVYAESAQDAADASEAGTSAQEGGVSAETTAAPNGTSRTDEREPGAWRVLAQVETAHGPYEINHVTWCRRFDAACERKGEEEMLVTTGDDGVVRPWRVEVSS